MSIQPNAHDDVRRRRNGQILRKDNPTDGLDGNPVGAVEQRRNMQRWRDSNPTSEIHANAKTDLEQRRAMQRLGQEV